MIVLRYLRPECIRIPLATVASEPVEGETDAQRARRLAHDKEAAVAEIADVLNLSGAINNFSKFARELDHRERKASTAIAPGIAIPHVRSLQVRTFIMGFARARDPGIFFASPDGDPVRIFFLLASPPYDDKLYHQVYRELATLVQDEEIMAELFAAANVQDVFNALRRLLLR